MPINGDGDNSETIVGLNVMGRAYVIIAFNVIGVSDAIATVDAVDVDEGVALGDGGAFDVVTVVIAAGCGRCRAMRLLV